MRLRRRSVTPSRLCAVAGHRPSGVPAASLSSPLLPSSTTLFSSVKMDRIESLSNTLSQITMYDIKSMYNQAKNVVFNVSEMEAKVREATNDDPWGASSTLMQDIAQGHVPLLTFNFQNFNEIMPAIYARFMEKEARQWRQIYKALQLLEYLIKNGSERVVDDARSHVATIKMLRNFYFIDDKGKDQGINVRNRSTQIVELLSDVEKIRSERRKAKTNKHKYTGVGNEAMSFSSGGSRYGGFGNDSPGYSGSGGSYSGGDYGGRDFSSSYSNGGGSSGFRDDASRRYQEYDAGDDEELPSRQSVSSIPQSPTHAPPRRSQTANSSTSAAPKAPEPPKEVDLLGMDDDAFGSVTTADVTTINKVLPSVTQLTTDGDDEFDDFQTAPTIASAPIAPVVQQLVQPVKPTSPPLFQQAPMQAMTPMKPMSPPIQPGNTLMPNITGGMPPMNRMGSSNLGSLMGSAAPSATRTPYMSPTAAPMQSSIFGSHAALTPTAALVRASATSPPAGGVPKPAASANFDDLWSMSLGSGSSATKAPGSGPAKSIKDLEKEKAQAGIWGSGQRPPMAAGFGSFGGAGTGTPSAAAPPSSGGGFDDLLF
ncbi:uncharacterized protein FIBRA_05887 [Fibroporia radiculosa]|uniref:ENTH domain-containing protein n=1 Tax=Fibroporia radiculosa TaxID=599839 RepID=J4IAY9_9APHY|nr:uncharacterized protein FIBRA_05887 [Fibroporia radiculosa]CCM03741.1 predicted protein [Fibroporia radiculosa]